MTPEREIPPPLSRNRISSLGWIITLLATAVLVALIVANLLLYKGNPYNDVVTYLVIPGFLVTGIGLILLGMVWEWRRRHKAHPGEYPRLPVVDLNTGWLRRRVGFGIFLLTLFFAVSAIGTYQAYHFTESPEFCGQVCHEVMKPEYTAYHYSPHARVSCTECHIGGGAKWYVKAKLSGVHQVFAVLLDTYKLPIETPVANLRPARDTCEECHWPEKFSGSMEKVIWHFASDEVNTPYRYDLLLKVGGGSPETGEFSGIHWHVSATAKIRYWARDRQRLDIPWVEVTREGSEPVVFRSPDGPEGRPPDAELRVMDCIDCHNRPSHIYRSALDLVDHAMGLGLLDASLAFLKRNATEVLERPYATTSDALTAIERFLNEKYARLREGTRGKSLVQKNVEGLQLLYQRNFFPEQKLDWRQYPNHVGHFLFPGCYRCHNDKHRSESGEVISNDCHLCHKLIDQARGQAAYGPVQYHRGEFEHPMNMPDIWKGHNCTDCHGPTAPKEGKPKPEGLGTAARHGQGIVIQ